MSVNIFILLGYGIFLTLILFINLLYFYQIFKYRLSGDASIVIVTVHIILMLATVILTSSYLGILSWLG